MSSALAQSTDSSVESFVTGAIAGASSSASTSSTVTTNITYTLPDLTNITFPSAALAGLCAPLLASAVAGFTNLSAPIASLQTSLEKNAQNKLFAAVGPVGGTIILALLGGVMAATAGGVVTVINRKRTAAAPAPAPASTVNPALELHPIPLTPGAAAQSYAGKPMLAQAPPYQDYAPLTDYYR